MLQSPGGKNEGTKSCLPNCAETSFDPAFDMSKFKLRHSKMRFMKFCDDTTHDSYGVLEVCNLDYIFDQVADKMDNIRQVEHCWNFINEKLSMKSGVSSAITHDRTYP